MTSITAVSFSPSHTLSVADTRRRRVHRAGLIAPLADLDPQSESARLKNVEFASS